MLWSKQFYYYDVDALAARAHAAIRCIEAAAQRRRATPTGSTCSTPTSSRCRTSGSTRGTRRGTSPSTRSPLALVDPDFAKEQLLLMLRSLYLHPNGQIPAYEWNFGDVNPPVHAWATICHSTSYEKQLGPGGPRVPGALVPEAAAQLHLVGQPQGPHGRNVFEGGFLGLDNIGVFDRSAPLPTGGYLEQADGTAWMAFFCQNMLEIAARPGRARPDLRGDRLQVRRALPVDRLRDGPRRRAPRRDVGRGGRLLLRRAAAARRPGERLKVRSMVGLLPLCAIDGVRGGRRRAAIPKLMELIAQFRERHPELVAQVAPTDAGFIGHRRAPAAVDPRRDASCGACSATLLDENEFLGPYGIRSLSRYHLDHPFVFHVGGQEYTRRSTCRPSPTPACSAATRTGAARSGCRSTR